jgi:hypothetical protein
MRAHFHESGAIITLFSGEEWPAYANQSDQGDGSQHRSGKKCG